MAMAECARCGEVFTGITAFDKHHDVDYTRRPAIRCMAPATVGLVQQESGRWGLPSDDASRARLAKIRAEQASARTAVTPPPVLTPS